MRVNFGSLTPHVGACILTAAAAGPVGAATGTTSGPAIEHTSARCVAPGRYPRIDARITSTGEVRAAHVVFRAAHSGSWYAVEMQAGADGTWSAALPRPKDDAGRIEYYIVASGPGSRGRFPKAGFLATEVDPRCEEGEGPLTATRPPESVGLVCAADPGVPGFEVSDIPGRTRGVDTGPTVPPPIGSPAPAGTRVRATLRTETAVPGRVLHAGDQVVGRLLSMDDEDVVLEVTDQADSMTIPRASLCQLDASLGVKSLMDHGAKVGGVSGSVVGGLAGLALGLWARESGDHRISYTLKGAAIVGLAGALIGAGLGSAVRKEKWERIDPKGLSMYIGPVRRRGLMASLTFRF